MINKLLKKVSLLFALTLFLGLSQSGYAQYCVPEGVNTERFINNFSTTNGSENISNLDSGFSVDGYGDYFDTQNVSQVTGESVSFSVDISGGTAGFRIWVDWNKDEVFDVTEEVVYNSTSYSANHTGSFVIPMDALEGDTRMRIVSHWLSNSGDADPCELEFNYGEFEDYKLTVVFPDACSGTPEAGIAMTNPTSGNPESSYTVSAQGYTVATEMTYLWQSNTNNQGWMDEGTATTSYVAYTATAPSNLGEVVEWRLAVTCTASGETSYSEAASFTTVITYCDATSNTVEAISRVVFAGVDNASPATSTDGYEDFTAMVAEVEAGSTYSFAAEGNTGGNYTNFFTVWIDWNGNGNFETTEMYEIGSIQNSNGTDGQQAVNDIMVPSDAVEGETRMRVRKNYNASSTDPCGSNTFGQVEDYTVNIGGAAPFPSPYCEIADADEVSVEEITKVEFAGTTIINDDTDSVLVDKTDVIVTVTAGETYSISVEGNTYGNFETNIVAFIDWNQNDVLDDAGEIYELGTLENTTGDDGVSISMDIAVPADAVLGQTRVRITKSYFDADSPAEIDPCGIVFNPGGMGIYPGFGQALDFTVEVEEGTVNDYCIPVLDCTDGDVITNVTFQDLDNTTACSPNGYGDYTDMSATVEAGGTYPISVTVGSGWAFESVSVWIDFNNNGEFDEEEFYFVGTGSGETLTADIAIPAAAVDGDYRMRVRVAADEAAPWDYACDDLLGFGETEDYTLTVDGIAGVNDYSTSNFTFYPNPMENVLKIESNTNIESVSAFNLLGQQVISNVNFTNGIVDVSSLPTGTFIFRIIFEGGQTENFKVIKKY